MDADGVKQPLLSKPLDSTQTDKKELKRSRFRRCKSAPLAEAFPQEADLNGSNQRSQSILGNLHPSFKRVAIILGFYLGFGTLCLYLMGNEIDGEKTNDLLDAVYFCIVTMTTVGYGDLVPGSVLTKLLACVFVFSGMALVGLILSKAADYLVEKQEILLVKALHLRNKVGPTEMLKKIETNRVRYKCVTALILLLLLIVAGTTFLALVENLDIVDAFYCACSTITTLGYGDKSFSTKAGRVFAVFWILTSTICLAQFFLYIAELNTENRQRELVKWVLSRRMTNVDLEAADLDDDGVVGAAEFIIYKLKEMGKISQEDVSLILEEFDDLDVDQSGTLSVSDIALAQPS
ncbi:two-pore potassium channel 1 [Rhodamnia argentea]|uniref:Two-pore potassium channel 1 isoform X2 n=1 Tax=Rhodamnia argentea TaxID=178133 RepID=A0A8B8MYF5_9MYRT|nr:two-pore potassium channel 1 [Rhodamnia argentea]XP_030515075.1 two-pore potassium channel 1 [Rhodamnia argentea]XP_030515147.1 two-pore potassium channel 1 [Rhodamnia argentea]